MEDFSFADEAGNIAREASIGSSKLLGVVEGALLPELQ